MHVQDRKRPFFHITSGHLYGLIKLPKPLLPSLPLLFSNPETISSYISNLLFPPSKALSKTHSAPQKLCKHIALYLSISVLGKV